MKSTDITQFRQNNFRAILVVMVVLILSADTFQVFAHGGEDHSEEPKQNVSADATMMTQVVRAGHIEVTFKHARLEPDTKTTARIFVTDYETNAAIENAKITLIVEGEGFQKQEVAAKATETPGILSLELPPIPMGSVKLDVQIEAGGKSEKASFGSIAVEQRKEMTTSAAQRNWLWTTLFGLGLALILTLIGVGIWLGIKRYKAIENKEAAAEVKSEIVSA